MSRGGFAQILLFLILLSLGATALFLTKQGRRVMPPLVTPSPGQSPVPSSPFISPSPTYTSTSRPTPSPRLTPTPTPALTPTPTPQLTPTPTPTPVSTRVQEVKTWLITYRERTGQNLAVSGLSPAEFTKQILLPAMNEASKFHGYSNPETPAALRYTLSDVNIHTEDNPRPASYEDLFNTYNLCSYAKANNIKAVIIWADGTYDYGSGEVRWESAITGNKGISTNGPTLSNLCDKTIVVYALDYTRGLSEALESYGHHLETVFRQFRPEYASWADESQNTMFQGPWFPQVTRGDSCGIDHDPPNARYEYDRFNTANYQSDCRNWKPDGSGNKETLNCNIWGCSGAGWLKWWMQNMPGSGNDLVGTNGQKIPNWWVYIGDPDNCYNNALSCSGF